MRATIIILALTVLCSCKKNGSDGGGLFIVKNSLVNKWELRKSDGWPFGVRTFEAGNGSIFIFKTNKIFTYSENGNVVRTGTYNLQTASEKDQYRLSLHADDYNQVRNITLKGDTLKLLPTEWCCDMPIITYVRVNG